MMQELRDGAARAAALSAAADLPAPDPVPTVSYTSAGNTLIIGASGDVLAWAQQLAGTLAVSVLLTDGEAPGGAALAARGYTVFRGSAVAVSGWLGAFTVNWREAGAGLALREQRFDLILDLSSTPLIAAHRGPPGYFAPGMSDTARADAARQLAQMVGEFEKPKYFRYKEKLCAHSRNRQAGCNACIDVCSARAIEGAGDRIKVNPYLCAGCGACTTVCPSGALGYAYPGTPYTGSRLQAVLATYASEGGIDPVILFHGLDDGSAMVAELEQASGAGGEPGQAPYAGGMPPRVIPLQLHHVASTGIDVWLGAVAYGASGVAVVVSEREAPQYGAALAAQMTIAQTILSALGYAGVHFQLIRADTAEQLGSALQLAPRGAAPQQRASFHLAADKRNTIDLALAHLYRNAPHKGKVGHVALPAGAPFGAIAVDTARCSLCMACVGACPESALMDSPSAPQLRFVEKNCVQCGLCVETCPEDAITLVPRMSFADTWNQAVLLNETEPFRCIRCNKPFGTVLMIQNMLGKLSQHSAFSGNLDRIRMCGDCRVIDMMQPQREVAIVPLKRR
jgi:ferredoxin